MPRFIQPFIYGVMKTLQNKKNCLGQGKLIANRFNGDFLTLRSPFFHYKLSKKYFGNCVDISESRLLEKIAVEDYDRDGVLFFRRMISPMLTAPLVGGFSLNYYDIVSSFRPQVSITNIRRHLFKQTVMVRVMPHFSG